MLMLVLVFVLGFMVARMLGGQLIEGDIDEEKKKCDSSSRYDTKQGKCVIDECIDILGKKYDEKTGKCIDNICTCENGTAVIGDMSSPNQDLKDRWKDICHSWLDGGSLCLSNSCDPGYTYRYIDSSSTNIHATSKCEETNYCEFHSDWVLQSHGGYYNQFYPGSEIFKPINVIECGKTEGCPFEDQRRHGTMCICKDQDKNIDKKTGKCICEDPDKNIDKKTGKCICKDPDKTIGENIGKNTRRCICEDPNNYIDEKGKCKLRRSR